MWLRFQRSFLAFLIAGLAGLLKPDDALATLDKIFTGRTGMTSLSTSGPITVSYMASPVLDGEFEKFTDYRSALVFHMTMASDSNTGTTRYFYGGAGRKYYFRNIGMVVNEAISDGQLKMTPGMRYFAKFEFGISHMTLESFGPVLAITSTAFEFGASGGLTIPIVNNIGLTGEIGYGFGYGFSSVAITASILKFSLGISFLY